MWPLSDRKDIGLYQEARKKGVCGIEPRFQCIHAAHVWILNQTFFVLKPLRGIDRKHFLETYIAYFSVIQITGRPASNFSPV